MSKHSKTKIVVLGTRGFPNIQGGVETHCQNLYSKLSEKGNRIMVLARRPYIGKRVINYHGVRLLPIICPHNKFTESIIHTLRGVFIARRLHPDILHFHAIGPSLFVPLARILGMKVVMTHHGSDYKRVKWKWPAKIVLKLGELLGCKYANSVIAISSGIKKDIKKKFSKNAYLIPNGITIPKHSTESDYIESLGLTCGKYILAVARFVPEKGLHDLISAYSLLQTNWKLVIAGNADHETSYSRELKSLAKDNNNIVLAGFIQGKKLNQIYSHAGLFILPSYHEGLPIAALEALGYGLSVLLSDITPNKEIELDESRYFPAGDTKTLKCKLEGQINKTAMSEQEQAEQINMVRKKYNWDNISTQVLSVYRNTLMAKK